MTISPAPRFPEAQMPVFERGYAPSIPGNEGPKRFEEGVASDTDVPYDFQRGAYDDGAPYGRSGHNNPEMFYKHPAETMRERAHVGSASWIEAPSVLSEFVQGSVAGDGPFPVWEWEMNPGTHQARPNKAVVFD